MHIQTCWQCGAKNQIDEGEAGRGRPVLCSECGAELPTAGAPSAERPWPSAGRSSSGALARRLAGLSFSHVLMTANVAVFIAMISTGVHPLDPTTEDIYRWGADFGPASLGAEPWRLLTSMFLHIGIIHLALNMYVLSSIGPLTEGLFGRAGFLALYLLSGVGGNLFSAVWSPGVVSAGASGAVFGLFGGMLGLLLTQRGSFPADFVRHNLTSILGFLAFNVIYGASQPGINNAAHMGGLATGFVFVAALRPDTSGARRWGARQLAGLAAVVMALCLLAYGARRVVDNSREARYRAIKFSPAKVTISPGKEVYFRDGAGPEEAQRLAQALREEESFKEGGEIFVILSKDSRGFVLSLYESPEDLTDPKELKRWEVEATDLSAEVFGGQPLTIRLCDESFVPRKTVDSGSKITLGPNKEIYYRGDVTGEEAGALAELLRQLKFGEGAEGAYVELSKTAEGYAVLFLMKEGTWDDADDVAWFARLAARLSAEAFDGRHVAVQLCDEQFEVRKTVTSEAGGGEGPRAEKRSGGAEQ